MFRYEWRRTKEYWSILYKLKQLCEPTDKRGRRVWMTRDRHRSTPSHALCLSLFLHTNDHAPFIFAFLVPFSTQIEYSHHPNGDTSILTTGNRGLHGTRLDIVLHFLRVLQLMYLGLVRAKLLIAFYLSGECLKTSKIKKNLWLSESTDNRGTPYVNDTGSIPPCRLSKIPMGILEAPACENPPRCATIRWYIF